MSEPEPTLACPSASPQAENARVFAVIGGTAEAPRAQYLGKGVELPAELLETPEGVEPTRIFRFTGTCREGACGQFANGNCQLGRTVARMLDPVADDVPACTIRAQCRWFAENGSAICRKCPQIVTTVRPHQSEMVAVLKEVKTAQQTVAG